MSFCLVLSYFIKIYYHIPFCHEDLNSLKYFLLYETVFLKMLVSDKMISFYQNVNQHTAFFSKKSLAMKKISVELNNVLGGKLSYILAQGP